MKLPYIQKFSGYSSLKVADSNRKEMLSVLEEMLKFSIQWKMDRKKRNLNCFYSISARLVFMEKYASKHV